MKVISEALEDNKVKLQVELDEAEVEEALKLAFRRFAHQVSVPGFRPGKAPRRLLEARVGAEAARAEALRTALPDHYSQALADTSTDAIAVPEITITGGESEGPVTFEATVEVRPVVAIPGYQGLKVTVPCLEPSDEDIDRQIQRMRNQSAELEDVDRPAQDGDFVTIDIAGVHNGEAVAGLTADGYLHELGKGLQALGPDFDDNIAGSRSGDVVDFISAVPPDNEAVAFHIVVQQVQHKVLPDLTDEWANEVSEFETVTALREELRDRLADIRKGEIANTFADIVISALAELVDSEPPDTLVAAEAQIRSQALVRRMSEQGLDLDQFLGSTGQSQEDFSQILRSAARDAVQSDLALRALAAHESIEETSEEIAAAIEVMAQQSGQKVARVRQNLENNGHLPTIRSDIRKAKAVRWLMDHVEIVDEEGRTVDREAFLPNGGEQRDQVGHDSQVDGQGSTTDQNGGGQGDDGHSIGADAGAIEASEVETNDVETNDVALQGETTA